jgi:predicted MFS family arabinose efflux permease
MRRRDPRLGRILDCSGAAAAVHEGWSLTNTQAGWLAGIVSGGYMLVVIPLVSLTDRRPARQLYLASSALSALSCFGMALSDSLLPALGFRVLAGIAMAGMYMPGLRALTHGVEGATRARIAAWYTSSFTIGASLSFLFGRVGTLLGWRSAFIIAGILGAAGVLIAWAALPGGDSGRKEEEPQPLLDFRPLLANRDVLALMVGPFSCLGTSGSADLAELAKQSSRRFCPQHQQREKRAQADAGRDGQQPNAHVIHQQAEEQR